VDTVAEELFNGGQTRYKLKIIQNYKQNHPMEEKQ